MTTTTSSTPTDSGCCSTVSSGASGELTCTLSSPERDAAALEWRDIASMALTSERTPVGTVSTFATDQADRINELVARENDCCGNWLHAETAVDNNVVTLKLASTSDEGVALIQHMAGLGPQ